MIDEKKLIEDIEKEFDGVCTYDVSPSRAVQDFTDIVDRQPKVGVWIPVSERLPEKDGYYFVTKRLIDGRIQTDIEPFWTGTDWWKSEFHFAGIGLWEVLAWQPLPEPYKAGEHHD